MIWSVSTSARGSAATAPLWRTKGSVTVRRALPPTPIRAHRRAGPRPRRPPPWAGSSSGCDRRALAPFEIAVGGRGAALPRLESIRVHPQAHRAPGVAPLESRLTEHAVEPLALRLGPHLLRPGDDHGPHARRHAAAPHHPGRGAQILDPAV